MVFSDLIHKVKQKLSRVTMDYLQTVSLERIPGKRVLTLSALRLQKDPEETLLLPGRLSSEKMLMVSSELVHTIPLETSRKQMVWMQMVLLERILGRQDLRVLQTVEPLRNLPIPLHPHPVLLLRNPIRP